MNKNTQNTLQNKRPLADLCVCARLCTTNLRNEIMDLRGFDSGIISILRGGIPKPVGSFPESLSQRILVGMILVGRLGAERQQRALSTRMSSSCTNSINQNKHN